MAGGMSRMQFPPWMGLVVSCPLPLGALWVPYPSEGDRSPCRLAHLCRLLEGKEAEQVFSYGKRRIPGLEAHFRDWIADGLGMARAAESLPVFFSEALEGLTGLAASLGWLPPSPGLPSPPLSSASLLCSSPNLSGLISELASESPFPAWGTPWC